MIFNRFVVGFFVLLCCRAAKAQVADPFSPEATARYPVMRVPIGPKPVLTGIFEVESQEWRPAHETHDFIAIDGPDRGAAGEFPTHAILKYDAKALYIGFKFEMPVGVKPKISAETGRNAGMDNDDAFEIVLSPDDNKTIFHLGGNAAGVTWERKIIDGQAQDWNEWNPNTTLKTQVENAYWTGEWEIPWTELGVETPKPESVWRVNFVAKRKAPTPQIEAWSYWREYLDFESNGRLIFGDANQPQFYMLRGWKRGWEPGGWGMWPNLIPAEDGQQKVETIVELLRRDINPAAPLTFLSELQARRDKAEGEGGTLVPLEHDVNDVFKTFDDVKYSVRDTVTIPVPNYGRFATALAYESGGDYLFRYHYRDVTNPDKPLLIAAGAMPFRIRQGVQVDVTPFLLSRQSVVATADLRAVPSKSTPTVLRAIIKPEKGDELLVEQEVAYPKNSHTQNIELSTKDLPVGQKYHVFVEAIDETGKVITSGSGNFNRPPDPYWWTQRHEIGAKPEVPKPWMPIQWKGGVASVWNRNIKFDSELFPQQIESGGKEILAAPIRLEMVQNGKLVSWNEATVKVLEQRPGHLSFEGNRSAGGVQTKSTHRFDFDGFSEYNITVEPHAGEAKIDELDLVVPLKAEYAQFLTNYANAPGPAPRVGRFAGKVPDHFSSPVMITTWLGNDEEGGLEFSVESARDWIIDKEHLTESITVDKKGETVEARFRFIGTPTTLNRARHYRFGLVTTPTKPVTIEQRRRIIDATAMPLRVPGQIDSSGFVKNADGVWKDEVVHHSVETVRNYFEYYDGVDVLVNFQPQDWATNKGSPWPERVRDPDLRAHIKRQEVWLREHNMVACRYGGWGVWTGSEEYDPWGKEMLALPLEPTLWDQYQHTYESPFVEWAVGSWAMNARELGTRGVRFDTVFPWIISANPYYDEAWVSEVDGKTYGKLGLFREREYLKRLWRIFNGGEVEGGIIYHPAGGPPMMIVESFVNYRETTEGFYMKSHSLKEGYKQEAMRVWMNDKPYGFIGISATKGEPLTPNNRLSALLVAGLTPRIMKRPSIDYPTYSAHPYITPTSQIWDSWRWIDRASAEWHPHWKNKDFIKSTSDAGEHYVSLYLQPGKKVLLIATNYEKQNARIKVQLDLKKLGFAETANLVAVDAVTGKPIEGEGSTLVIDCEPELYRLIKIGTAENVK